MPFLPMADRPEAVGLSSAGLDAVDALMQARVDSGEIAGALTLVARHGRTARISNLGLDNVAKGKRLKEDSISRIFSMTKPITGTAMMILCDEGRWAPEDPIARHLPNWPICASTRAMTTAVP